MKDLINAQPKTLKALVKTTIARINHLEIDVASMVLEFARDNDNKSTIGGKVYRAIAKKLSVFSSKRENHALTHRALLTIVAYYVDMCVEFETTTGISIDGNRWTMDKAINTNNNELQTKKVNVIGDFKNRKTVTPKGHPLNEYKLSNDICKFLDHTSSFNSIRVADRGENNIHYMALRVFKETVTDKNSKTSFRESRKFHQKEFDLTPWGKVVDTTRFLCGSGRDFRTYRQGYLNSYGDTYQKTLNEYIIPYIINEYDTIMAKKLLLEEFYGKVWIFKNTDSDYRTKAYDILKTINAFKKKIEESKKESELFMFRMDYDSSKILSPKEFGNMIYFIDVYNQVNSIGKESRLKLRFDFVNCGAIHQANATRVFESCQNSNLLGEDTRYDTHMNFVNSIRESTGKEYARNDIKGLVSTPYYHGSTTNTISNNLELSKEETESFLKKANGENWNLASNIADWGSEVFKKNSLITFTMPDGFVANTTSYTTATEFTAKVTEGDLVKIDAMLPSYYNSKGEVMRTALRKATDHLSGSRVSIRSLYAVLIHAIDAYVLRELYRRLNAKGIQLDSVLDELHLRGLHAHVMLDVVFDILEDTKDLMQDIINQIADNNNMQRFVLPKGNCELIKSWNILTA